MPPRPPPTLRPARIAAGLPAGYELTRIVIPASDGAQRVGLAVGGALATVLAKNPIRGAMGLLMMIVSIAGMAAGFTVLFGAPLGSAVFALEILHRRGEPSLEQERRHDPLDEPPQLGDRLVESPPDLDEVVAGAGVAHAQRQQDQPALQPVVQVLGQSAALVVTRLDEPGP